MYPVIYPDLSPVIRTNNDAFARVSTRKVTQHSTRIRDNSRGISSDTSRPFSLDRFIDLSRGNSRGVFIKAFLNTSLQDGIHTPVNYTCDHSITRPLIDHVQEGAILG